MAIATPVWTAALGWKWWDGYGAGLELTIAERVRALLAEPEGSAPPGRRLADVIEGAGRFEVVWATELPPSFRVSGLSVPAAGPGGRIVMTAGDMLAVLDAGGTIRTKIQVPSAGLRLFSPATPSSDVDVVAWRPGSPDLIAIDLDGQRMRPWTAPSPVLDVEASGDRAVFASLGGVAFADVATGAFVRTDAPLPLRSVAAYGENGSRIAVLDDAEKLLWLGGDGVPVGPPAAAPAYSWGLACAAPDGAVGGAPSPGVGIFAELTASAHERIKFFGNLIASGLFAASPRPVFQQARSLLVE